MDAFETATATASQADLLRLQQEILAEASQDDATLGPDDSPQATALRDAIKSARVSISGDLGKMDTARADLGKVSSACAEPGANPAKPITDIKGFARDLDSTVASFQQALAKNDTGSMLRLQKSLSDQADQADADLKDVQSKPAEEVLSAVAAIRAAFARDTSNAGWSGWGIKRAGVGDVLEECGELRGWRCGGPALPIQPEACPGA